MLCILFLKHYEQVFNITKVLEASNILTFQKYDLASPVCKHAVFQDSKKAKNVDKRKNRSDVINYNNCVQFIIGLHLAAT